ncbi:sigma-54 interacting transcriptional regulator [Pseudomonas duriflava]|uniref:Sigma-54 interacting transcriptional regulator n=1 Tax=Pseudomonas duriflava TaxID=459528 RepID=A0A562PL76_9PSED|nr:sigma-54 interacting transcriptional regulator [Pseudomonas duriflava]
MGVWPSLTNRSQAVATKAENPLGTDPNVIRQFEAACKAFMANILILLQGETGTGKEVFARSLHNACSPQAPFVAIKIARPFLKH